MSATVSLLAGVVVGTAPSLEAAELVTPGDRIVFFKLGRVQGSDGVFRSRGELWTIRLDGSDERRIPVADESASLDHPDLSPDGRQVAASRCQTPDYETRTCDLVILDVDGANLVTVPLPAGVSYAGGGPRWSPDGSRLAFNTVPRNSSGEGQVAAIRLDGSGYQDLGSGVAEAWSPDGGSVLVTLGGDGFYGRVTKPSEVRLRSLDRKSDRLLRSFGDYLPYLMAWSPDGTVIA